MNLDAKPKLPKILRIPFWEDFVDSVTEELNSIRGKVEDKEIFFDVDRIEDRERLIEISRAFGYIPDLSLDDSLENLKENVSAITFRIRNKSNFISYKHLFKTIPYPGELFVMYNADVKLVRAGIPVVDLIDKLESFEDYSEPFIYPAEENYSRFLFTTLYLDMGLSLDSLSQPWSLDVFTSSAATKHIAVELALSEIITRNGDEFLMVSDKVDYLFNGVDYTRKLVEVPHVGTQLSFILDESGYYDSYSEGTDDFSIPKTKTIASVTDKYVPEDPVDEKIVKMVFGSGSRDLVSVTNGGSYPNSLESPFSFSTLVEDEKRHVIVDYVGWKIIDSYVQANSVRGDSIATGNDEVIDMEGQLSFPNVEPFSLRIPFRSLTLDTAVVDNGQEGLFIEGMTDYSVGSINYDTGEYNFITEKREDVLMEVLSLTSQDGHFVTGLSNSRIIPGSLTLRFRIGETGFIKYDNGVGGFTDYTAGINAGTINYVDGSIDVVFISEVDARDEGATEQGNIDGGITVTYSYIREFPVNYGEIVDAEYRVEEDIPITEVGLEDDNGDLVAYATFPPIVLGDPKYHASFQFFIRTGNFNDY